ncbi:YIP1 family protein [Leisingera aquaemixtae]|uniref:Yip1 domain protein n=1 Tax=Leisingera aquaemixtae TaxID=1396826 RepID=A0A0P1HC78_9RHOB|nr:YIP1 family protein [Leisingera aquaemixtae]CUI00817.1 Yip1 domain protein [Leisingera aquaemixtae]
MSVTTDIPATYKGPRKVFARLLSMGAREDRLLVFLIAGCVLTFVAQMPKLAREAHLTGQDLNMLLGGALLGIVFIAPLLLYVLALVAHWIARAAGGQGDAYRARLALFWAFLASSPLILLNGLVAGFIGAGAALNLVGALWCAVFLWFWISGMIQGYWTKS